MSAPLSTAASKSLAERFARLPESKRTRFLQSLNDAQRLHLVYCWRIWARPKQLAPHGEWLVWLILAGRGFGKTRTGAEWVIEKARDNPGCRIALIGATAADVRDTMVEGESGILACSPPSFRPKYEPSKRRLTWPNGSRATCFAAEKPARLRGPQHHFGWADELAAWKFPEDAWDMFMMGLRLGEKPQVVVTTTPRPIKLLTGDPSRRLKGLLNEDSTRVTKGSTSENKKNLSPAFIKTVIGKYEGTRLGRQELDAEILDDTPGALWSLALLDKCRVGAMPPLLRTVVALDPSVAGDGGGDECGIVLGGIAECDCKVAGGGEREMHAFVFEDLSANLSPESWAIRGIDAYTTHKADRLVAEVNNGGGLVETTIRLVTTPSGTKGTNVAYKAVHASVGKRARAEPVVALYEQGRVHHVGSLSRLEDEQRTWVPLSGAPSPNRLDAVVWLLTELLSGPEFFFL